MAQRPAKDGDGLPIFLRAEEREEIRSNKLQEISDELRQLADRISELTYCDLLEAIIDDSDIEQTLAALDSLANESGESLMAILRRWETANPDRRRGYGTTTS